MFSTMVGLISNLGSILPVCRYVLSLEPKDAYTFPLKPMLGGMSMIKAGKTTNLFDRQPIVRPVMRSPNVQRIREKRLSLTSLSLTTIHPLNQTFLPKLVVALPKDLSDYAPLLKPTELHRSLPYASSFNEQFEYFPIFSVQLKVFQS